MATLLSFTLLLLLTVPSTSNCTDKSPPAPPNTNKYNAIVVAVCKASQDPTACSASLSSGPNPVPPKATVLEAIQSALRVSSDNLQAGRKKVQEILGDSSGNHNRSEAAKSCLELLRYSDYRTVSAGGALPRGSLKDARAWMSASLLYQYDCWSALKYVNDTSLVNQTMAFFNSSVIARSSDALGMMVNLDVFGGNTDRWGPVRTERDGFWEPVSSGPSSGPGSVPVGLKADATVCKTKGNGCGFTTVQGAVNACPDNSTKRFVIRIRAGVYEETVRVNLEKANVVMIGDGMGKTVITGSLNVGLQGTSTYNSATLGVVGDGFMASGLTIRNTAGAGAHQAVAFRSDSDKSIVENCEFLGNQDTLYAHSLRQYYKSCRIQGNVDFIFGNSASFFQDCVILVAPRLVDTGKGVTDAVTAHGRTDPAQSTGFVFQNCVVNGTDAYMAQYHRNATAYQTFLGRPWKAYSRTVFLSCVLEVLITPAGWLPWSGDFALSTLYYGEFKNTGAGSGVSSRVSWSNQIPAEHVSAYSAQNFIQGGQWNKNRIM